MEVDISIMQVANTGMGSSQQGYRAFSSLTGRHSAQALTNQFWMIKKPSGETQSATVLPVSGMYFRE
jgi:hypothetical protein